VPLGPKLASPLELGAGSPIQKQGRKSSYGAQGGWAAACVGSGSPAMAEGGQRVGEDAGGVRVLLSPSGEKAHRDGCSTPVRLNQWRQAGGEAGNAVEVAGEHHGVTVELGDEKATVDNGRRRLSVRRCLPWQLEEGGDGEGANKRVGAPVSFVGVIRRDTLGLS
jgi:hypothetical protein